MIVSVEAKPRGFHMSYWCGLWDTGDVLALPVSRAISRQIKLALDVPQCENMVKLYHVYYKIYI